jgi:hypothetical protein
MRVRCNELLDLAFIEIFQLALLRLQYHAASSLFNHTNLTPELSGRDEPW